MQETNIPEPTDLILFRLLTEDDVDNVFSILGNAEVMRFSIKGPAPRSAIPKWLSWQIKDYNDNQPSQYAVLDRQSSLFLGFCGFIPFKDTDGEAPFEIGFRYHPSCWNKGIGTEAARSCLAFGFSRFDLTMVAAVVERENVGSVRILEKVGMKYTNDALYHGIPVMRFVMKRDNLL